MVDADGQYYTVFDLDTSPVQPEESEGSAQGDSDEDMAE